MKKKLVIIALMPGLTFGGELKDPFFRDDDISGTQVEVEVSVDPAGNYVYTYDIAAPETNTGYILSFDLDVTCDTTVDRKGFSPADYQTNRTSDRSEDIPHVPVAIDAPYGQAGSPALTAASQASWMLAMNPGGQALGLTVVSPYPPGDRAYRLVPSPNYKWDEYDYEAAFKSEDRENIPWIDDWTVSGMTVGPACPGDEYPDDGGGEPVFAGSLFEGETDELNQLLTYTTPLQDQFHREAQAGTQEITIHYHADIDPKSFVVTPQRHGIRKLFHPAPDTSETVLLPLDPGKNRIELKVKSRFDPPGKAGKRPADAAGREGVSLDKDVFVVRVPADVTKPGGGKGAKK